MIYIISYLIIGFVASTLLHLYFQETEDYEFFIFIFIWPIFVIFFTVFFVSKIFKPYLTFLGKLKWN